MLEFSEGAKHVVFFAQAEAARLMQPYIDIDHILLGLLRERRGIAAEIFKRRGINTPKIIKNLRKSAEQEDIFLIKGFLPFSDEAKRVIDYAAEEAESFGCKYIDTEHLLLGLVRGREGKALSLLLELGLDEDSVRDEILSIVASSIGRKMSGGRTPLLDEFGRDLTLLARQGKLDPVIGRETEINRLIQILSRRQKNNAVLLGEPGVGKTAIVEGLACKMIKDDTPDFLRQKRLISLEIGALIAGTKYRGQFEERMKLLLKEIEADKNVVIFIDEIHTVIGAGAAEGSLDAANMLKPALARGALQCIGATTLAEYRKQFEKDGALERRFQTIFIGEPSPEQTIEILKGVRRYYEDFHKVSVSDRVIEETVFLSDRYITDKRQPDKSIDVIDETCAKKKLMTAAALPDDVKKLAVKLDNIREAREKCHHLKEHDKIEKYTKELEKLSLLLKAKKDLWKNDLDAERPDVSVQDVADVVSVMTGVPTGKLQTDDKKKAASIDKDLKEFIIGQDEAIDGVAKAIRRSFAGLANPSRPIGSFIFLGPTGVGKTEVAKRLAALVFGSEDALIRIDMSEFMEKFNVSRLVGAPPGYVGYEEGGKLTEQVRRRPYSVVLFDEVEKAHPEVANILLQILDEGFITDSLGHKVNFKNTIIILTSNIGTKEGTGEKSLGFGGKNHRSTSLDYNRFKSAAEKELKNHFPPEFLNRLDNIVYFKPLGQEELSVIMDIQINEINKRLERIGKQIVIDEQTKKFLLSDDYPFCYGARPIKRILQNHIEDKLADILINEKMLRRKIFHAAVQGDEVVIK